MAVMLAWQCPRDCQKLDPIHTITATSMQKPIDMQNTIMTLFLPSILPWDFCVS